MKTPKIVLIIAISLISLSSFAQSLTNKTPEELEQMKKEAISIDNFELAGKISAEQKSRVSIDDLIKEHKENLKIAAAKEDFAEAERLQKEINRLEEKKITLARLEDEKKAAIQVEDFEKVLALDKQISELKSDKKSATTTAPVSTLHSENGTKDMLNEEKKIDNISSSGSLSGNLFIQGQTDASKYYKGYKGAGTGTFITSLLSPLVGLIPAIACSSTQPKETNLNYTNADLMKKSDYYNGYTQKSKKIKQGKVWTNWGIAFGVNLILVLIILM